MWKIDKTRWWRIGDWYIFAHNICGVKKHTLPRRDGPPSIKYTIHLNSGDEIELSEQAGLQIIKHMFPEEETLVSSGEDS